MTDSMDKNIIIGKRQLQRQVALNNVERIIMARDCDREYKDSIVNMAKLHNVLITIEGTRSSIAIQYGIDVDSAVVAILKESI